MSTVHPLDQDDGDSADDNTENRCLHGVSSRMPTLSPLVAPQVTTSGTTSGGKHYDDVIMTTMASHITSLTIVYSTVYSGADQRKHQSSASLAFVRGIHRGPVNSPHKRPVTRKTFPFDDVIMVSIMKTLDFQWTSRAFFWTKQILISSEFIWMLFLWMMNQYSLELWIGA